MGCLTFLIRFHHFYCLPHLWRSYLYYGSLLRPVNFFWRFHEYPHPCFSFFCYVFSVYFFLTPNCTFTLKDAWIIHFWEARKFSQQKSANRENRPRHRRDWALLLRVCCTPFLWGLVLRTLPFTLYHGIGTLLYFRHHHNSMKILKESFSWWVLSVKIQ